MRWDTEPCKGQIKVQTDIRYKTGSFAKMQGLSSRAHAFSVEALVGKPCKRMKVSEGHESSSAGDTGSDTGIFTGEAEGLLGFENTSLLKYTHILRTRWNNKTQSTIDSLQVISLHQTYIFIHQFSQFNLSLYFVS